MPTALPSARGTAERTPLLTMPARLKHQFVNEPTGNPAAADFHLTAAGATTFARRARLLPLPITWTWTATLVVPMAVGTLALTNTAG